MDEERAADTLVLPERKVDEARQVTRSEPVLAAEVPPGEGESEAGRAAPLAPVLELPEPSHPVLGPGTGSAPQAVSEAPPPEPEPASQAGKEGPRAAIESLMHDTELLAEARTELAGGLHKGFSTVLLAAPEEQVEIARFFGEELVLVPRTALDPSHPSPEYFRLSVTGAPSVERIGGGPPLEDHRQYRDLFDYEYARLPAALRELRRSLVARGDVYLFAALLSTQEWALVIARRRDALESAGRTQAEVRRFVLRYVHLPGGGFDLRPEELVFTDGSRFVPGAPRKGDG